MVERAELQAHAETYWYRGTGSEFATGSEVMKFPTAQAALEWALESRIVGGKVANVPRGSQGKVRIYRHPRPRLPRYMSPLVLRDDATEVA
jgi:hypothetical protein